MATQANNWKIFVCHSLLCSHHITLKVCNECAHKLTMSASKSMMYQEQSQHLPIKELCSTLIIKICARLYFDK